MFLHLGLVKKLYNHHQTVLCLYAILQKWKGFLNTIKRYRHIFIKVLRNSSIQNKKSKSNLRHLSL